MIKKKGDNMQETFGNVTVTYEDGADKLQNIRPEDVRVEALVDEGYDCRNKQYYYHNVAELVDKASEHRFLFLFR